MALTTPVRPTIPSGPAPAPANRVGTTAPLGLTSLEVNSDRPEVQSLIGEAIRQGTVRVLPVPGAPDLVKVVRVPPGERTEPAPDRA